MAFIGPGHLNAAAASGVLEGGNEAPLAFHRQSHRCKVDNPDLSDVSCFSQELPNDADKRSSHAVEHDRAVLKERYARLGKLYGHHGCKVEWCARVAPLRALPSRGERLTWWARQVDV